jgi:hypothetical protein
MPAKSGILTALFLERRGEGSTNISNSLKVHDAMGYCYKKG